jgi:hypothetical protein
VWSKGGGARRGLVYTARRSLTFQSPLVKEFPVSRLLLGAICGLIYGALSAASMIPLKFDDKTAALTGAFLNRFAIGFVIGAARLPVPPWAQGLIFGLLLSLPDAIITKAYAPILVLGVIGGVIIGLIVGKWGV